MKDDSTSSRKAKATSRDIKDYWTPERRAKAKPVIPPTSRELKETKEVKISKELKEAKPVVSHAKRPTLKPRINTDFKTKERAIGVVDPTQWPYICCGKLFFTQGGGDWAGSASAIGDHLLLTAGHCLYEDGEWSDNVTFYPAYPMLKDESGNMLSFSWSWETVFNEWMNSGDQAYDFGMIYVETNMTPHIGHLGWMYNYSPFQSWKALGYPHNPPYSGEEMYEADGAFNLSPDFWEAIFIWLSGQMRMDPNNMHHGSSGGPWLATLDGRQEYANGVNSHHNGGDDDPTEISPYFDGKFKRIYDDALNG